MHFIDQNQLRLGHGDTLPQHPASVESVKASNLHVGRLRHHLAGHDRSAPHALGCERLAGLIDQLATRGDEQHFATLDHSEPDDLGCDSSLAAARRRLDYHLEVAGGKGCSGLGDHVALVVAQRLSHGRSPAAVLLSSCS